MRDKLEDAFLRLRAVEQDLNHLRRVMEGLVQRVDDIDEVLCAENERLRAAAEEVLSWNTGDTSTLLSNPPQNAGLFHAQRVLRAALEKKP
jgi:hypothetical protein